MSDAPEGSTVASWVAGAISSLALIIAAVRKLNVDHSKDRAKIAEADAVRAEAEVTEALIRRLYDELKRGNDTNDKLTGQITKLQEKIQVMSEQMFLLSQQNRTLRHEIANLRQQVQSQTEVAKAVIKGPTNT